MKLSWSETTLPFFQQNSNIEELLATTLKFFELKKIHLIEICKDEQIKLPCGNSLKIESDSLLNNPNTSFCKVSELTSNEKNSFKGFNGILKFHENYSLKYLILFQGKISAKKLYAHLFPCLNSLLKIEVAEKTVQEDFLCRINHELKTPLNAIMGQLNILSDENTDTKQNLYISESQKSAKELLNRIDNLLIYAKYTDEFVSNPTTFGINFLIQELLKEFESLCAEKNIKLIFEALSSECEIYSDPYYIKRIIYSLIENSCAYTNEGEIKTKITIDNLSLKIEVSDSGIGFAPDLISKIKKKAFTQEEEYKTRSSKGTGLSLNLCFKIADNLGGDITIVSEKNRGTCVSFSLPITKSKEINVDKFYGKVLIVEDDKNNQLVATKYLQKLGFSVDIANHGKEALMLCEKNKYTFILMDCQMPVMDGYEATKKIKSQNPDQVIIACTAHALSEAKDKCLAVGMNAFLTKPLDRNSLKRTIFEHIPECADNFDETLPLEIAKSEDTLNEGIHFIETSLLPTFKKKIDEDIKAFDKGLSPEELRKVFHRLKSTYAQFGFVKSQTQFALLQKSSNFNLETFTQIKKQTTIDLIALEQWINNKKELLPCA